MGTMVVDLRTHPTWDAAQRRSRDLAAAMRRHPSSYVPSPPAAPSLGCDNVVTGHFGGR